MKTIDIPLDDIASDPHKLAVYLRILDIRIRKLEIRPRLRHRLTYDRTQEYLGELNYLDEDEAMLLRDMQ